MKRFVIGDIHGGHKALLQCFERSGFNPEEDSLVVLGDVVDGWPEVKEVVDELIACKHVIPIIGNHDCFDTETEVFTNHGWRTYTTLKSTDLVIGLNEEGTSEWQPILDVIIQKSKTLFEYENKKLSMCITDKHRILHQSKSGYTYSNLLEYKQEASRWSIPLTSNGVNKFDDYPISDAELRLLAWSITDGSIDDSSLTVYQSKVFNVIEIEQLLNGLDIEYKKRRRDRDITHISGKKLKTKPLTAFEFYIDTEFSKEFIKLYSLNKHKLPKWLYTMSDRQFKIFFTIVMKADGTWYKDRNTDLGILYGTKEFLSEIQALCSIYGVASNFTTDNRGKYRLNINYNSTAKLRGKFKKLVGNFTVWDLTVPLTNFLVRRHGKSYYTGNSWFMEWYKTGYAKAIWTSQGGQATVDSYSVFKAPDGGGVADAGIIKDHIERYFNKCFPYYIDEENNIYVHGGFDWHKPIEDQDLHTLMWDRHMVDTAHSWLHRDEKFKFGDYKTVFVGHTTTQYSLIKELRGSVEPLIYSNLINLDTGGGWSGKLTIMDVDSKEYWQSDLVPELYPGIKGRG